jgi:hypothetical protein
MTMRGVSSVALIRGDGAGQSVPPNRVEPAGAHFLSASRAQLPQEGSRTVQGRGRVGGEATGAPLGAIQIARRLPATSGSAELPAISS